MVEEVASLELRLLRFFVSFLTVLCLCLRLDRLHYIFIKKYII